MSQSNNDDAPWPSTDMDKPGSGLWAHLRKYLRKHGHAVHSGILHGAGTKIGSGAVTLIILWLEARR